MDKEEEASGGIVMVNRTTAQETLRVICSGSSGPKRDLPRTRLVCEVVATGADSGAGPLGVRGMGRRCAAPAGSGPEGVRVGSGPGPGRGPTSDL